MTLLRILFPDGLTAIFLSTSPKWLVSNTNTPTLGLDCLQSAFSLKIRLLLSYRDCKPWSYVTIMEPACSSRAWVSLAVTLQRKIRDCSQSTLGQPNSRRISCQRFSWSLSFGAREATTGNTSSAVRWLTKGLQAVVLSSEGSVSLIWSSQRLLLRHCVNYISIIFLEYQYHRELLYSTEPFYCQRFIVNIFPPQWGREGRGESRRRRRGRRRETRSQEVAFKHTSLLKTKDLISSDPDSFRFALEKIVGTIKTSKRPGRGDRSLPRRQEPSWAPSNVHSKQ